MDKSDFIRLWPTAGILPTMNPSFYKISIPHSDGNTVTHYFVPASGNQKEIGLLRDFVKQYEGNPEFKRSSNSFLCMIADRVLTDEQIDKIAKTEILRPKHVFVKLAGYFHFPGDEQVQSMGPSWIEACMKDNPKKH